MELKLKDNVLLVIDITNSWCHADCEIKNWDITFEKIRKMIPRLKSFISDYKKSGGQVIYVNCVPWDKEHLAGNIVEFYKDPKVRFYSNDKTGFPEKFFQIEPEKGDIIITKNSYDAFTNPELDKILKGRGIRHITIAGILGDGCVNATIHGGFSRGYNFIILKDLIETTDMKTRQELQKLLKDFLWPVTFGKTINSKDFFRMIK
jgi:ureidoacrylate peracid hydrolase